MTAFAVSESLLPHLRRARDHIDRRYAAELDLDVDRFHDDLKHHVHKMRVAQDVESADVSGATGTPTFFVNGQRHYGAYDLDSLAAAVTTAGAQLERSAGGPL